MNWELSVIYLFQKEPYECYWSLYKFYLNVINFFLLSLSVKMPNNQTPTHTLTHIISLYFQNQLKLLMLNLKLKFMKLAIYLSNQCSAASDWDCWHSPFQNNYDNEDVYYQLADVSQIRWHHTLFPFASKNSN